MDMRKSSRQLFAICVDNAEYPASLELRRIYRILPDADAAKDGDVRIIDESGEDYLYPASCFVLLDVSQRTAQALSKAFARAVTISFWNRNPP